MSAPTGPVPTGRGSRWTSRDPVRGARVLGLAAIGGAAYVLAGAVAAPSTLGPRAGAFAAVAAYAALAVALGVTFLVTAARRTGLSPVLVLAVLGTCVLGLHVYTRDLSFAAQAYLAWPVLYATHYLRAHAAWAVAGVAMLQVVVLHLTVGDLESLTVDGTTFAVSMAVIAGHGSRVRDANEELVARLDALANVDALTGLGSRRALDSALRAATTRGLPFALVLADLDGFKHVNDRAGHAAGDVLLREVSDLLRGQCRTGDVAARLGGDELALLVRGGGSRTAERLAEDFRRAVERSGLGEPGRPVTVSVGVARCAAGAGGLPEGTAVDDLLARADRALYAAKRAGRNQVVGDPVP